MAVRWMPALVVAALWWWAVLRMALVPGQTGWVEGAMVAGGWGLSLLPVHVAAAAGARPGPPASPQPSTSPRPSSAGPKGSTTGGRATRAWRRRRSDAGSDPS
ncbi:hypothetical protein ACWGNF_26640 [Streptomyces sp. NPDC055808]|uniref:hypothetical protein n=1 Tax=Streptomyces sp. NPDC001828 TaxID=3364615 RepID=UPI00367E613F